MHPLETERLLLERWSERYREQYLELLADEESMRYLGGARTRPDGLAQFAWYERHWQEHGFGPRFAIEKASAAWVGMIGLRHVPDEWGDPDDVEVGWIVASAVRGQGFGEEGARGMLGGG